MGQAKNRRDRAAEGETIAFLNCVSGKEEIARYAGRRAAEYFFNDLPSIQSNDKARVPCNGCSACCYHDYVEVDLSAEKPECATHLSVEIHDSGALRLQKRADGACIHLTDDGCGVYDYRPRACRWYDCRISSLAGTPAHYLNGAVAEPVWIFDRVTARDHAVVAALQMTALAYVKEHESKGESWTSHDATALAVKKMPEVFPKVLQFSERMMRETAHMTPDERMKLAEIFKARLS